MTELRSVRGFEDALRPPVDVRRARITPAVLKPSSGGARDAILARVERVARRVPEVMVKVTGRTRDGAHLRAHFQYIGRNGEVPLETADGRRLSDPEKVRTLAQDWAEEAKMAGGRRDAPLTHAIILSMPAGTDANSLHDAARAFAAEVFADRFAYVFALHDEGRHPHVHLTVQSLGRDGERLNPRKADLQVWRERFAHALRARGIEAEATPRRTRGVTRKAERMADRKLRERFESGQGDTPGRLNDAAREASNPREKASAWDVAIRRRQTRIRRLLVAETLRLKASPSAADRVLGSGLEAFIRNLPAVATRRQILERSLNSDRAPRESSRSRGR
ncbi:relaxase/mobilization nuclease domain-containing protein [Brevundimonas naejangsanensis]|uniref:relaxase/mobilization nuclease domain-containing protein n=1 Tax=Brevundimonas naejangsanensis TaxID=588932 RepID=UPI00320AE9A9